jgi:hypothetical protein
MFRFDSSTSNLGVSPSKRTVIELLARADELRRMAQTARTSDIRDALLVLAKRFEALAAKRTVDQSVANANTTDADRGGQAIRPPFGDQRNGQRGGTNQFASQSTSGHE